MKIVITGGSGFIGNHLINELLTSNPTTRIINIDIRDSQIIHPGVVNHKIDIRDSEALNQLSIKGVEICIHLAALCKEPGFEWNEYFATNHQGTLNIIQLCKRLGISKILFTSTMMVYKAGDFEYSEDSPTAPDTAYGISKLLAEKELEKWKDRAPTRWLKIVRPAVVFGKNERGNFTTSLLFIEKGDIPIYWKKLYSKSEYLCS